MPIWLRTFTYKTISDFYEKEKEEYEKATGKGKTIGENTKLSKIGINPNPTYTSKVTSKK